MSLELACKLSINLLEMTVNVRKRELEGEKLESGITGWTLEDQLWAQPALAELGWSVGTEKLA